MSEVRALQQLRRLRNGWREDHVLHCPAGGGTLRMFRKCVVLCFTKVSRWQLSKIFCLRTECRIRQLLVRGRCQSTSLPPKALERRRSHVLISYHFLSDLHRPAFSRFEMGAQVAGPDSMLRNISCCSTHLKPHDRYPCFGFSPI